MQGFEFIAGGQVRPFRYFAQKVLPTVYDDSLSYLELLEKMEAYLNNVITAVNANSDATTELQSLYESFTETVTTQLQGFQNYFDNLDVQEEINNKLDAMVLDGTLSSIILPIVQEEVGDDIIGVVDAWLVAHPEATTTVQDGSITNAKLVQTGGVLSEVEDIRTGYDGIVYPRAGDAVRRNLEIILNGDYIFPGFLFANVSWSRSPGGAAPVKVTNPNRASFNNLLFARKGAKVHIESYSNRKFARAAWSYNNDSYTNIVWDDWKTDSMDWIIPDDCYFSIVVANSDDITPISLDSIGVEITIYDNEIYFDKIRIDALENTVPTRFSSEMEATIATVRECLTEPCLVFPKITDIHYAPNSNVFQNFDDSIELMKYFTTNVHCDCVVNLGDNINGSSNQSLMLEYADHMLSAFNSIGLPYLFCMGNHDTNYDPGLKFNISQTYRAFMSATKDVVFNYATNGTDFYKDFDDVKIRMVFINTQYLNAYFINPDTVTWLADYALNTDYTVVLCEHMSTIPTQNTYATSIYQGNNVTNVLTSFVQNGGTIIQLFGHAHADYAFTTPWLSIASTCGKFEHVDVATTPWQSIEGYTGSIVSPTRTQGTATEQAWDVVIIRPTARKINLVRFGAGDNREFDF